jgi:hypothetical protein
MQINPNSRAAPFTADVDKGGDVGKSGAAFQQALNDVGAANGLCEPPDNLQQPCELDCWKIGGEAHAGFPKSLPGVGLSVHVNWHSPSCQQPSQQQPSQQQPTPAPQEPNRDHKGDREHAQKVQKTPPRNQSLNNIYFNPNYIRPHS